jgi:putative acetyltransferase
MTQPSSTPQFTISPVRAPRDLQDIKTLFIAYADSLDIDLSFQSFSTELSTLPGAYRPPYGEIFIARRTCTQSPPQNQDQDQAPDQAIGCVALRPLTTPSASKGRYWYCELKRLYVHPSARGLGLGRALAEVTLQRAREIGYREIRLDTLGSMEEARGLYGKLGFENVRGYYETPVGGTVFLGMELKPEGKDGKGEGRRGGDRS